MKKRKRKQKTIEQRRRQAGRRQQIFHLAGKIAFVAVLLTAAILAVTVFFKVNSIEVEGNIRYTQQEIVDGMDVKMGDNLYLWNKVAEANNLRVKFPYLESVRIRRHLPDTLIVSVTECKAALAVPADGGYYLLSSTGKVLEQTNTDGGLPVITGVSMLGIQLGQTLDRTKDAYINVLMTVLDEVKSNSMMDEVRFINLQSLTDIRIGYLGRFDIRVGTVDQVGYRLRFAKNVIEGRLSPSDVGRLYWDGKQRLHFVPDTAENVALSATILNGTQSTESGDAQQPADTAGTATAAGDKPQTDVSGEAASGDTAAGNSDEAANGDAGETGNSDQ